MGKSFFSGRFIARSNPGKSCFVSIGHRGVVSLSYLKATATRESGEPFSTEATTRPLLRVVVLTCWLASVDGADFAAALA